MAAVAPEVSAIGIRSHGRALAEAHNAGGTRRAVHTGVVDGRNSSVYALSRPPPFRIACVWRPGGTRGGGRQNSTILRGGNPPPAA